MNKGKEHVKSKGNKVIPQEFEKAPRKGPRIKNANFYPSHTLQPVDDYDDDDDEAKSSLAEESADEA